MVMLTNRRAAWSGRRRSLCFATAQATPSQSQESTGVHAETSRDVWALIRCFHESLEDGRGELKEDGDYGDDDDGQRAFTEEFPLLWQACTVQDSFLYLKLPANG